MPFDLPNLNVQAPDPLQTYGKLQSLSIMQAQQQERQKNAPLIYQQNQAAAQQATIAAQQAQRAQDNQQIWVDAHKTAGGDLDKLRKLAETGGATLDSLNTFDNNRNTAVINKAKAWNADNDVEMGRNDKLLPRLDAFMKKTPQEQKDQFSNWLDAAHADGAISDEHYLATQKAHDKDNPPNASQLADYRSTLLTQTQVDTAAKLKVAQDLALQNAASLSASRQSTIAKNNIALQEKQKADLFQKASGAQNLNQWNQTLLDAGVPMDALGDPPFDPQTGQVDPAAMARLNRSALTAPQKQAADNANARATEAAARDARNAAHQKVMEGQGQQRINQGGDRIDQGQQRIDQRPSQVKADHDNGMKALDNKVMTDTMAMMAGQGKTATAADAVNFLRDKSRWGDNPDVDNNRVELIQRFSKMGTADLKDAHIAAGTAKLSGGSKLSGLDRLNAKTAWTKANPGQGEPTDEQLQQTQGGKSGASAASPGAKQPSAAPPPAAAPVLITEQEARQRAIAAGKDPDWIVNQLRARKLLK